MHKSRLAAIVIDSNVDDIEQANNFWTQALGQQCVESTDGSSDKYSRLDTADNQPHVLIQKVSHQSRVHLDIETDNIEAEAERLIALGAVVVEKLPRWIVMEAPTGHRFCIVNPQRSDFSEADDANHWP